MQHSQQKYHAHTLCNIKTCSQRVHQSITGERNSVYNYVVLCDDDDDVLTNVRSRRYCNLHAFSAVLCMKRVVSTGWPKNGTIFDSTKY